MRNVNQVWVVNPPRPNPGAKEFNGRAFIEDAMDSTVELSITRSRFHQMGLGPLWAKLFAKNIETASVEAGRLSINTLIRACELLNLDPKDYIT